MTTKTKKARKAAKKAPATKKAAAPAPKGGKMPVSRAVEKAAESRARKVGFDFTAGYLIQTEFAAEGGVTYDRRHVSQETDGRAVKSEFVTTKRVDDVELNKDSRSIIWRAYYVLSKHATNTPIGYFADAGMLETLEKDFDEVRTLAREFNGTAVELYRQFASQVDEACKPLGLWGSVFPPLEDG